MGKCKAWGIYKMKVGHIFFESLICASVFHTETLFNSSNNSCERDVIFMSLYTSIIWGSKSCKVKVMQLV